MQLRQLCIMFANMYAIITVGQLCTFSLDWSLSSFHAPAFFPICSKTISVLMGRDRGQNSRTSDQVPATFTLRWYCRKGDLLRFRTSDGKFNLYSLAGTSHEANESNRFLLKSLKTGKHVVLKELHVPVIWLELSKFGRKNVASLRTVGGGSRIGYVEVDQADTFKSLKAKAVALIGRKKPKLFTDPEFSSMKFYALGKQLSGHMLLRKVLRAKRRFGQ